METNHQVIEKFHAGNRKPALQSVFCVCIVWIPTEKHIFFKKIPMIPLISKYKYFEMWNAMKAILLLVPIWPYLSFRLYSQYLRCPIRVQSDLMRRTQFDPRMDGTWHTSHNDCVRSILKCMCAIANSRCEWFDHPMHLKSMDIRDGRMSFAHNPNGPAGWKCTGVFCSSRTKRQIRKTYCIS